MKPRIAAWGANAQMALDTIAMKPTRGIPSGLLFVMDWALLEEISQHPEGAYQENPEEVYRDFQLACGVSMIDQWIPRNPLGMTTKGYESDTKRGATTGAGEIVLDGMSIGSPEDVVEHMERYAFPRLHVEASEMDSNYGPTIASLIYREAEVQEFLGPNMLKIPYNGFQAFPCMRYGEYGYQHYFTAYALFPELMEQDFKLQAEVAIGKNRLAVKAIIEGACPRLLRLDHDMADSRGTLVDIKSLDRIWFPHFSRSVQPFIDAGIRLIWHCDGNLMQMVPRLIEGGIRGFQGFQYEDGMDYQRICKMTDREGNGLLIWAGASSATTLPYGSEDDVAGELKWLVEHGPPVGLFLGGSSSIVPGTNRANVKKLIEGLKYYASHGRGQH